jgi:hypothetical protein
VADGQVARGNPYNFKVIDGKVYFPASWRSNLSESTIKSAEIEWARIDKKH